MKNGIMTYLGSAIALFTAQASLAATTDLTVYTAFEPEQLVDFKQAFERQNPDIGIKWVRDSTGVITARLLAEKASPKADVIWGVAATSLMLLDQQQMLAGYAPKGLDKLDSRFRDSRAEPHWVGLDAWFSAICFNTVEAKKQGIPEPKSWADLTKPVYRGKIIMPNPSSSGTGFLSVSGWLQTMGNDAGWKYMADLHQNIERYTHSGSAPCKLAASGETVVGISFDFPATSLKKKGAPIEVIYPVEGSGWDMEAAAIMASSAKQEAARKLLDFTASREANVLYNKFFAVVAMPGVAQQLPFYPEDVNKQMIKNDFGWAAKEREAILKRWSGAFDGKSEPKKP